MTVVGFGVRRVARSKPRRLGFPCCWGHVGESVLAWVGHVVCAAQANPCLAFICWRGPAGMATSPHHPAPGTCGRYRIDPRTAVAGANKGTVLQCGHKAFQRVAEMQHFAVSHSFQARGLRPF